MAGEFSSGMILFDNCLIRPNTTYFNQLRSLYNHKIAPHSKTENPVRARTQDCERERERAHVFLISDTTTRKNVWKKLMFSCQSNQSKECPRGPHQPGLQHPPNNSFITRSSGSSDLRAKSIL